MDTKIRAISLQHNVKISIVDITETMKEITKLQGTNPLSTIVLSKFTAANTLLGIELKNGELTTSKITSNGPVKKMVTEFENNKIRSQIEVADFDASEILKQDNPIASAVGNQGDLTVLTNSKIKDSYTSRIELVNGSIDDDYMNFLRISNQIKSFITTKVKLNNKMEIQKVVGFLIQLLPDSTDEDIDYLDKKIGNSNQIGEILLKSQNYETIIKEIIDDAVILDQQNLKFECSCSREKTLDALRTLGKQELQKIINENQIIEVMCDFCKTKYNITIDEIKELI